MKQIGAEIGVNESRVSQLHARAIRRLRDALGTMVPAAEAAALMRSAILSFQQKPKMAKATLESRGWTASGGEATNGVTKPGVVRELRERFTHGAQQVGEPERLGEPAAAAVFEKALGVGAGDVAGDEDDAPRQRRRRGGNRAIERHPVDPRHLQVADHDVVHLLPHAGEGFLAVARVIDLQSRIAQALRRRLPPARARLRRPAPTRRAPLPLTAPRSSRGAAAAVPIPLTGSSTKNAAPRPGVFHANAPAVFLDDGVGHGQPQPGALADFLGREKGVEDFRPDVARHARAVVAHFEDDRVAIGVVRGARSTSEPRPLADSIACSALITRFSSTC